MNTVTQVQQIIIDIPRQMRQDSDSIVSGAGVV
jgi:hypothetical protein